MSKVYTEDQRHMYITFAFIIFLVIYSLVQPYTKHN